MGRKILAVIVAMITAVAIIWVSFMVGSMTAPFYPKNMEYMNPQEKAAYMSTLPVSGFVTIAIGYVLAAFAGGFIATKMGRRWSSGTGLALAVGVLLTIGALLMSLVWPQPLWFVLVSIVIFIPISLFGYRLASHAL